MADIKFGFNQIVNETPSFIKKFRKALTYFSGGVVVFLPTIADAMHVELKVLTTIMGLFILFVNSLAAFFGIPDEEPTK